MKFFILTAIVLLSVQQVNAQGCVAIRSNGAACMFQNTHEGHEKFQPFTQAGLNNRYFKSFRHFVGTEEQKERTEHATEVINYFFSSEISLTRQYSPRSSVSLFIPVTSNQRSSLYEHYGNSSTSPNARRRTGSFGLGDIRVAGYYWLTNPAKVSKVSVQGGAGIKLPTGDYEYKDYFHRNDSTRILGPVDQSIQLGDGGTGFSAELNAGFQLRKHWSLYSNVYYLFNPREQNGVSTARGGTPSATSIAYGSDVMSVPDQFMCRLGGSLSLNRFQFSGGMRVEGVPAKDVIGGSSGFRRPGYVLSVEPVVVYKWKSVQVYLSVPYAMERNRIQSVPDKVRTQKTGTYYKGDAAFADYSVNAGMSLLLK